MGAGYIILSPFPLLVSVDVYASMCDFVCIALLSPFVLGFCLSVFLCVFFTKKIFFLVFYFSILITLFYFISLYFILSSSFFLFSLLF